MTSSGVPFGYTAAERHLRHELVDRHPASRDHLVAIRDAVHEGERHLLRGVRAGVTKVRTGNRDRVEPRDLGRAELDRVGDEPQRRPLFHVGVVGVVPALRRQVEGDREARPALAEQVAIALVRLLGGPEARVLANGPQAPAVPAGEVAPSERERARCGNRLGRRKIGRAVAGGQGHAGLPVHRTVHEASATEIGYAGIDKGALRK